MKGFNIHLKVHDVTHTAVNLLNVSGKARVLAWVKLAVCIKERLLVRNLISAAIVARDLSH